MTELTDVVRRRLIAAMGAGAVVSPFGAIAQGLSARPIRFIVPFTPAAGPDIVARILAPKLQARWGQTVIVENKPGASGTIGADFVAKSAPDGHTIMVGPASALTAPLLYAKLPYDVIKDLTPITNIGSTSLGLAVHKDVPANNVQEFIAYAKARPGKLNYGSPGNGTHHHLCMELLKLQSGIDIVHVPYKGSAGADCRHDPCDVPAHSRCTAQAQGGPDQVAWLDTARASSAVSRNSVAARTGRHRL